MLVQFCPTTVPFRVLTTTPDVDLNFDIITSVYCWAVAIWCTYISMSMFVAVGVCLTSFCFLRTCGMISAFCDLPNNRQTEWLGPVNMWNFFVGDYCVNDNNFTVASIFIKNLHTKWGLLNERNLFLLMQIYVMSGLQKLWKRKKIILTSVYKCEVKRGLLVCNSKFKIHDKNLL